MKARNAAGHTDIAALLARLGVEAREFADDHRHRYCALLARHQAAENARHA